MWTSDTMSFMDSLQTFIVGFAIVFVCLIALAIFIIIVSKIIGLFEKKSVETNKVEASNVKIKSDSINEKENENLAVIIGAISEEIGEPVDNFKIVSIKEI